MMAIGAALGQNSRCLQEPFQERYDTAKGIMFSGLPHHAFRSLMAQHNRCHCHFHIIKDFFLRLFQLVVRLIVDFIVQKFILVVIFRPVYALQDILNGAPAERLVG